MFLLEKKTKYAKLVKLCAAFPIMRKIMHVHNCIIPLSLTASIAM